MTAPISNGPTTHGYTTMRDATANQYGLAQCRRGIACEIAEIQSGHSTIPRPGPTGIEGAGGAAGSGCGARGRRQGQGGPRDEANRTQHNRPHWCEGRRRDRRARLRCPWVVAGPGRASRRRAERSSRRGQLAGGPPPTGTPSSPAQQGAPSNPAQQETVGKARRSSPSEPCARAGASRPGRSGCGPRCAAPRLRCR